MIKTGEKIREEGRARHSVRADGVDINSGAQGTDAPYPASQDINWKDFRDHLATADKSGRRVWLHPRQPKGRFYRARTWLTWVMLLVMFGGPFVRIQGEPLLLMNIVERKFVILGQVFWPQDGIILAIGLLVFFMGIAIFTAAFGRLWCGWTCPQTVMMEMVFRKIEYAIEGDSQAQRALAKAPWTASKLVKKVGKQIIFFALSFIIGNTLYAYIIGTEQLFKIITDKPAEHITGLAFMLLFTGVFYAIFARFREQACTFICPYGRFQSTLIDENSIVVAYDYKRGEKRGRMGSRRREQADRALALQSPPLHVGGYGDCVDCFQCVTVCPTGIDIRNGTQMECVNCTACIDACDSVMDKIKRPRGLIRYASLNGIERRENLKFTLRLKVYTAILVALIGLEGFLVFSRSDVETTMLRAPGAMFQQMPDGRFSNLYTVKVVNKTAREMPVQFKLENLEGTVQVMGQDIVVAPRQLAETSVLIDLEQRVMKSGSTPLVIGVYSNGRKIETIKTSFIGPRHDDDSEHHD